MEPSRQTTVLFADITGSTRLYETAGDSRAAEEIAVCMQKLREAVEAHGGRVVKTMGDAIMALFSTPNAAAAAAARMQTDVESLPRSEERRVGKECRSQWAPHGGKKRTDATLADHEREIVTKDTTARTR